MDNPVTRLIEAGLSYSVQATLVGVDPVTVRRWEEDPEGIKPFAYAMLTVYADAIENDLELPTRIARDLATKGVPHCIYLLLREGLPLSTVDT